MSRTNYIAPSPQSGYILNPMRGYLSVIETEETENIIENPSVEFVTTGWTAVGGTIALSTAWQTSGANSLLVTPAAGVNDGAYYLQSTTINTRYTWSLDFRGTKGIKYSIRVYGVTGAATLVTSGFVSTGFLQNLHVGFDTGANTSVRAYVEKAGHTSVSPFYVDSMQIEAKNYSTTFCDGDKPGCMWRGQPHASRSARSASSPGGRIRRLDQYGFQVLSISGLDMPPIQPSSTDYALQNGAVYQGYRATTRSITIVGTVGGARLDILQHRKHKLMELFKPNTPSSIPITFRYQAFDGCRAVGDEVEFSAVYAEGLEGVGGDNYQERLAIRLTLYDPLIRAVQDSGVDIDFQDTIHAHFVMGRLNGQWNVLGVPNYGAVTQITKSKIGPDGKLYVAGSFTNWDAYDGAGNPAHANYITRYNFITSRWETISAIGDGVGTGLVRDFCWGPDGKLYLVGDFHLWDGVGDHVVSWDGAVWDNVGNPHAGTITSVNSCAFTRGNVLWVVGQFTDFGGTVNANGIANWDGVAWVASANFGNVPQYQVVVAPDGVLWSSGAYISGGVTHYYVGTVSSLGLGTEIGTGLNDNVLRIAFSPSGVCCISGAFTTAGGYTVRYLAKLDGADWVPIGTSDDWFPVGSYIRDIALDSGGNLYASFASWVTGPYPGWIAKWNGFAWTPLDFYMTTLTNLGSIAIDGADNIFVSTGWFELGSVKSAGLTTITNRGSANTPPIFTVLGPGKLYTIFNETTGEKLWFNLTLAANEKAILKLGNNPSFSSTFSLFSTGVLKDSVYEGAINITGPGRGNIISTILPGSNLSSFHLVPGVNKITCLIAGTTDGNTSIKMYYKPTYWGVQDASGVHK
jgi:hypothetical protein